MSASLAIDDGGERVLFRAGRGHIDKRLMTLATIQQIHRDQLVDGFPDRGATDTQLLGQFVLAHQAFTGFAMLTENQVFLIPIFMPLSPMGSLDRTGPSIACPKGT